MVKLANMPARNWLLGSAISDRTRTRLVFGSTCHGPDSHDFSLKNPAWKRGDRDAQLLPRFKSRRVLFRHISKHPHRGHLCHDIDRRRAAGLYQKSGAALLAVMSPVIGDGTTQRRVDLAFLHDLVDFGFVFAEYSYGSATPGSCLRQLADRKPIARSLFAPRHSEPNRFFCRSKALVVRSSTPAVAMSVELACTKSGLSIVKRV